MSMSSLIKRQEEEKGEEEEEEEVELQEEVGEGARHSFTALYASVSGHTSGLLLYLAFLLPPHQRLQVAGACVSCHASEGNQE